MWACRRLQARNIHKDILFLVLFFVVCFIYAFYAFVIALCLPHCACLTVLTPRCIACFTVFCMLHCALLVPLFIACLTALNLTHCASLSPLFFVCINVSYCPHCSSLAPLCLARLCCYCFLLLFTCCAAALTLQIAVALAALLPTSPLASFFAAKSPPPPTPYKFFKGKYAYRILLRCARICVSQRHINRSTHTLRHSLLLTHFGRELSESMSE